MVASWWRMEVGIGNWEFGFWNLEILGFRDFGIGEVVY
jgi:hypothetical protein